MDITAYITLLFSYLLKNSLVNEKRANPKESRFCNDILEYIKNHYTDKVTSKQAASDCFLNHSYFCRKFKENFGMNFSAYLNIYRISVARALLEENKESVSAVSEMCGFDTPAYFSRCFKSHIGVLPQEYKKGKRSL
jgi:two-component system response regulator YesN